MLTPKHPITHQKYELTYVCALAGYWTKFPVQSHYTLPLFLSFFLANRAQILLRGYMAIGSKEVTASHTQVVNHH